MSAGTDVPPFVYQVTKYDPADRDERGRYTGAEDVDSDHGPVEAAYLAVVAAFAEDSSVTTMMIREPGIAGPPPADLSGYHDGAEVSLAAAVELVRAMLRGDGVWCRLEVEGRFFVHVGYDQYLYVGSTSPCRRAVELAHDRGLFAEPITRSPYEHGLGDEPAGRPRVADAAFWSEVRCLVTEHEAVVLEERYLQNVSRWHHLKTDNLDPVRAGLTARSAVLIWPDLHADVSAVLAGLPEDGLSVVVWRSPDGTLAGLTIDERDYPQLATRLADATAATVMSGYADESCPLAAAVLPDDDGVLRARWTV